MFTERLRDLDKVAVRVGNNFSRVMSDLDSSWAPIRFLEGEALVRPGRSLSLSFAAEFFFVAFQRSPPFAPLPPLLPLLSTRHEREREICISLYINPCLSLASSPVAGAASFSFPPCASQDRARGARGDPENEALDSRAAGAVHAAFVRQDLLSASAPIANASHDQFGRVRGPHAYVPDGGMLLFPQRELVGKAPRPRFNPYGTGGDADFVPPPVALSNGLQARAKDCFPPRPPRISRLVFVFCSFATWQNRVLSPAPLSPRLLSPPLPASRLLWPFASIRVCG